MPQQSLKDQLKKLISKLVRRSKGQNNNVFFRR